MAARNTTTGHVLTAGGIPPPFTLERQGGVARLIPPAARSGFRTDPLGPTSFTATISGGGELEMTWTTDDPGVTVESRVLAVGDELELWARVDVAEGALPPLALVYPVLGPPAELSSGGTRDRLAYPAHSGVLLREPLAHETISRPYPDGYDGCSMQFLAYYEEGGGGFYLATHDPHATWKHLSFGADGVSVRHEAWDLRPGAPLDLDYPVVLAAVTGGWYGAAQRYRRWAHGAPWVAGPQAADPEAAGWLRDEVGLAVWGAPSSLDWSPWYHHLAGVAGTPLHVIAGWDWPASRPHNVGREGWFPARFHPANVESWQGHRVTPYLNDLFISNQADDFAKEWEPTLLYPYVSFNWSIFSETLLALHGDGPSDPAVATNVDFFCCPAAEAAVELHAWRDATLVAGNDLDGVCYDISSGNPAGWSRCWRTEHGHPPGRGRGLIEAYDEQNRRSKAAAMAATGRYLAQGVEVVIEPIIGSIDFYVARAGAGPLGALESWTLGPEDPPGGDRELIPLFEAVYHDVGPVREDGWFTLAEDDGDLFFWLAARIAVRWGALVSLHYAINPPHRIEGSDRPAEVIDWGGALRRFEPLPELDPAKAAFVAELAAGRTELANPYLAHGRLLRPLDVGCPDIELRFARRLAGLPHLRNEGTWSVPRVVHGAWEAPDGAVGLVFVDVSPAAGPPVTLDTTLDALGAGDLSGRPAQLVTREARHQLATITAGNRLSVELPLTPRRIAVLEILPPAGQGR